MSAEDIARILAWLSVFNYILLIIWFLGFRFFHDWIFGLHGQWFLLDVKTFDAIHYAGIAFYKIAIFLLFLGPYIVIRAGI